MKRFVVYGFLLIVPYVVQGQNSNVTNGSVFSPEKLQELLLKELNRFRAEKGLDTLEIYPALKDAASMSAMDMADEGSEKTDINTSLKYLQVVGATNQGRELTMKAVISKGREDFSSEEIAKVIYNRWENNEKNLAVLTTPKFLLCGISAAVDEEGDKVYVSAFFGGYDILNDGVKYKKQLAVPFNAASKKLKDPDPRSCKTCEQWKSYDKLHEGLYVKDNKIMLRYPDARDLRRIFRKETDGIAVDVVQKAQYMSAYYNIVDNNLKNKGVMTKVIYKEKFFKKNVLITKDKKANRKVKGIEVEMGKFNPKISGDYELNLIIVQDNKVCKTITRGYNESNTIESNTPLGLLPMEKSLGTNPPFEARSQSSILNFVIQFQKNKSEFKEEDIQPFLIALNEPDFIIDGLYIYAYSSIEGDSLANLKLQQKRAESVVNVLQNLQNSKITPTIIYRDSWGLFLLENEDGKYADLVNLGKQKAIEKINSDKALLDELEPILAKERFAQIVMDVTYDLSGEKEKRFAIHTFNKAVNEGNQNLGYKVLDFISKRIKEGKYPPSLLDSLMIGDSKETVGIVNNQIYHKYKINNTVEEEDAKIISRLLALQPDNAVLQYNALFCGLTQDKDAANTNHQNAVQQTINQLYSKIDSNLVNGLNIEWQFRIMESVDTLPGGDLITENCIARIKSFYNITEATWQNAMKLSEIFMRTKDYKNAANVLEAHLQKPNVNENLVYMYISAASRVKEKYYSRMFARALEIAKEKNQERYCKLFGEPFMTFQVLENPEVKKTFQLSCGSQ